jgi:phage/plasmid-associated DNA primase
MADLTTGDLMVAKLPKRPQDEFHITIRQFDDHCQVSIQALRQIPKDPLGEFLDCRCQLQKQGRSRKAAVRFECRGKTLRDAYRAWCADRGLVRMTDKAFGIALSRRGISTRKSHGLTVYVGIHLNAGTA